MNNDTKKKRVRPPRNKPADHSGESTDMIPAPPESDSTDAPLPAAGPRMIPAPPNHLENCKDPEWMDWIFTHLPIELARNFYGRNYTPRS